MRLFGCCTPNLLTSLNEIIGVLHTKPPHQSQWEFWGAAPQTSSPVSMGLLVCCTPNLLTSLNGIIGVLYPKPPHKSHKNQCESQYDYSCDPLQNLPVLIRLYRYCTQNIFTSLPMLI